MIQKETFMPLEFFKKSPFYGSLNGMHYRVLLKEEHLLAEIWPGPYCYDATPAEQKQSASFAFTQAGILDAIDWLNEQYVENQPLWESCPNY